MADPISLVSGLVTSTLQSSTALCETVKRFQSHSKQVRDLIDEIQNLNAVLGLLAGTVNATSEPGLSALDRALLRCGQACGQFELEIMKCSSQSRVNQLSILDWAQLEYMGEDIDGFTQLLAGYRLTFHIALTAVTFHESFHTADPETLENYEAHLESINTKLERIQARLDVEGSDLDTSELQQIEEERLSTEGNPQISTWSSDHYRTLASDNVLKVPTKITKGLSDLNPDEDDLRSSDNDNESDNESVFTRFSDVSSAASFPETANARMEVAHFLLNNKELRHLFEIALEKEKFDMKKIKRNMKSLISSYGANLEAEASNPLQQTVANFVHNSAMQVTVYMTQVIMQKLEVEQLSKGNQVNIMLESLKSGRRSSPRKMASINDHDGGSSDDDSEEDSLDNQLPLQTLENVKEFMVSAKAFRILVDEIKLWLGIEIDNDRSEVESFVPMAEDVDSEPTTQFTESRTMSDQSNTEIQIDIMITVKSLIPEIVEILQKMLWPQPAKGFKRIIWRSALGRTLYIDVKERFDGAAERLQNRFRLSATKTIAGSPVRVSSHSTNRMLTVSSTTQRSPLEPTQSRPPIHPEREPTQLRNLLSFTSTTTHVLEATDRRYLLLCFSTSHSEVFQQIDVTDMTNDQYLFESIHKTYCKVREEEFWYSKLCFLRQLSTSPWFKWFTGLHLYAPKQINFVSFNLMPLREIPTPINITTPSLPPESEVREKKNWHYEPCPRGIEEYSISAACVQQLLEPGHAFLDNAWLDLFPKKLRGELLYESGKTTIAWGINIVEGINVAVVAWLGLLILITIHEWASGHSVLCYR